MYLVKPWRERAAQFPSVSPFSAEPTRPIFTKILHDIVALVALLNAEKTTEMDRCAVRIVRLNAAGDEMVLQGR